MAAQASCAASRDVTPVLFSKVRAAKSFSVNSILMFSLLSESVIGGFD